MNGGEDRKTQRRHWIRTLIVVFSGIFSLGILPIAFNSGGMATRLSFLPGISDGGGFISALSYTLFLTAFVGVVLGGVYASEGAFSASDSDIKAGEATEISTPTRTKTVLVIESPEKSTQTTEQVSTESQISTSAPTSTPTQTATATATPTPTTTSRLNNETDTGLDYVRFAVGMQYEMKRLTNKPIHMKGMYGDYNNATLWVIMNGTNTADNWTRAKAERSVVVHAYRRALVIHKRNDEPGDRPLSMRFVDWNESSQTTNPDTFFVHSSDAWAYQDGKISANEFFQRWFRSSHAAPEWVEEKAKEVARDTDNLTFTPLNESSSNEQLMEVPRSMQGDSEANTGNDGRNGPFSSSHITPSSTSATPVVSFRPGHVPA